MIYPRFLLACLCMAAIACNNSGPKQTADSTALPPTEDTLAQMPGGGSRPAVSTDDQLFETALAGYKTAIAQNNEDMLKGMIHPGVKYDDVRNYLPKAGEEQVKEVPETEQAELRKLTDTDSKLFEVNGVVFGKVQGTYKIVGHSAK